ncbi:tRNA1(Val) (adenine(37)-N6)-methyltransferase [Thalassovita sp.]|uniref:tRNA1(Val) (adenine(37)-N6)-methyltransferase n=1 Tax=Thalassovita sp. TaxID=1979401 RepID=UPI002B276581|nr:methyltransferase domain-containing protein [Thalassovita sp.]
MDELTHTQFLDGRVSAWQPARGYRAGVDPVLLAASIPGEPGQSALELGCGVGVASLCLLARVPDMRATGLEIQPAYAALARRNATEASAAFDVVQADLTQLPTDLRNRQFDHVFANPPYFQRETSVSAADPGRDIALGGETPLADWVEVAAKRVRPKGYVSFIQRVERLPELLCAMQARLGSLQLLPLLPRRGRESQLFLIRGRKGGRAAFRLHAAIVMHEGDTHTSDQESYTSDIQAVLREGAALAFPK